MRILTAALAGLALSVSASAQANAALSAPQDAVAQQPTHGLAGKKPGTERWIVTFKTRSFDLEAFRLANLANEPAAVVNPIVAGLEAQMKADQAPFVQHVENLGGAVVAQWWIVNGCSIEVPFEHLAIIRKHPNVATLEPDQIAEPVSIELTRMPILTATNAANHNADAVQAAGIKGAGVGCAIVDTGQDSISAALGRPHRLYYSEGNLAINSGGIGNSRLLANIQIGAMVADDVHGHGTGVCGIAAGGKWNANANSDHGHASQANIIGFAISDNTGGGSNFTTITNAWNSVAANKALYNIVAANNSYSGTPNPLDASQQALDNCARNANIMICCAAGNGGASTASSQSVANGLAVAACDNNVHAIAGFSSKGPLSGDLTRTYPDITGNGVNTVMPLRDAENDPIGYVASGTSMASPQVCGAATLYRHRKPAASALETKAALLATTLNVAGYTPNTGGAGYLKDDALIAVANGGAQIWNDSLTTAALTKSRQFRFTGGVPYMIALTWHRQNTTTIAWTDMTLTVSGLGGGPWTSASPRNLYEWIRFTPTTSGCATITVSAAALEAGQASVAFSVVSPGAASCTPALYSPIANELVEGNSNNTFPFGTSTAFSYEQINGDLKGRSGTFTRLSFRRDGLLAAGAYGAKTINASLFFGGGKAIGASTNYLANYIGARTQVVAPKPISVPDWSANGGSPSLFNFNVPLDAPYSWTGLNDFIFEFRVTSLVPNSSSPADAVSFNDLGSNTGAPYGAGCVAFGKAVPHSASSTFTTAMIANAHTFSWSSINGPNSQPAAFNIGTASTNIPLGGLCSNIYTLPVFSLGGSTDAAGTFNAGPISIGYNPGYAGFHYYAQAVALDPLRANPLKACISNGVDGTIPASPGYPIVRIYTLADAAAVTGTLGAGYGLVLRLD